MFKKKLASILLVPVDKIKRFIGGECPSCHSTNLKAVKGWGRNTCKDCGETFNN